MSPQQRQTLITKESAGFYFDFCIWSYKHSQKQTFLLSSVQIVLNFYGLSQAGNIPKFLTKIGQQLLHYYGVLPTPKTRVRITKKWLVEYHNTLNLEASSSTVFGF